MWDLVRFTQQDNAQNLVNGAISTLRELKNKGYKIIQIKNTFLSTKNPYKGVNVKILSPDKQRIELQFNTYKNLLVKEKQHLLYEVARRKDLDEKTKEEVNKAMDEVGYLYEPVEGIQKLPNVKMI